MPRSSALLPTTPSLMRVTTSCSSPSCPFIAVRMHKAPSTHDCEAYVRSMLGRAADTLNACCCRSLNSDINGLAPFTNCRMGLMLCSARDDSSAADVSWERD